MEGGEHELKKPWDPEALMNINEPGSRAEAYGNDDDDAGAHKNPVPQIFFWQAKQ